MQKLKSYLIFIMCMLFVCEPLTSCHNAENEKNPILEKTTDERIIMSLEKTYPEHEFKTVKKYGKYDGQYYAICADENGLEFKVDTIIYDNTYHFGCHDEYLKEVLEQQSFIEKATAIAEANGYEIEYDGENSFVILIIDISDNNIDVDKVSKVIIDILNSVDVPELVIGEEEFSTGEVNYYTESKMREIFYNFVTENGEILSGDAVRFQEKESIVEELAKNIQVELEYAYENLNTEL